jgi:hypothetical protein
MTRREAVLVLYLFTFCLGITATLLARLSTKAALVILLQDVALIALIALRSNLWGTIGAGGALRLPGPLLLNIRREGVPV